MGHSIVFCEGAWSWLRPELFRHASRAATRRRSSSREAVSSVTAEVSSEFLCRRLEEQGGGRGERKITIPKLKYNLKLNLKLNLKHRLNLKLNLKHRLNLKLNLKD